MTGFLLIYGSVAFYGVILALGALSYLFSSVFSGLF